MAKLFFAMNMSPDGYVDHQAFAPPDEMLFRHFVEMVGGLAGSIYGHRLYEIMRYWDEDRPEWTSDQQDFSRAWRNQKKWVVSRSSASVGPNATLINENVEAQIRELKEQQAGEIEVGGPNLANYLTGQGLIDRYQIYLHPIVLGQGTPFFAGPHPPLRLIGHERIGESAIRLTYVPA
jgi:dihydrofolate reductase